MMNAESAPASASPELEAAFRKILDSHGYGFHYAILEQIKRLRVPWEAVATEFPVRGRAQATHIDLVLRRREPSRCLFLVGECKRANPALFDWCFIKTPPISEQTAVVCELVTVDVQRPVEAFARPAELWPSPRVYQLGFPIKGHEKGDSQGEGREALQQAVAQVSRAAGGLIDFLGGQGRGLLLHRPELDTKANGFVLPVIFTTARLWTTTANLAESDLDTGSVPATVLKPAPWLWFGHNISADLKHSLRHPEAVETFKNFGDHVLRDVRRCIAIVSVDGIQNFLGQEIWGLP